MNEKILDKVAAIEHALEKIYEILPSTLEGYKNDENTRAACERYFERVMEGVVDLSFLIVKEKDLEMPEGDIEAFNCLAQAGIINTLLSEQLQNAKRMRNIIIHLYGEIDDEKVYHSFSEELEEDIYSFLACVRLALAQKEEKKNDSSS